MAARSKAMRLGTIVAGVGALVAVGGGLTACASGTTTTTSANATTTASTSSTEDSAHAAAFVGRNWKPVSVEWNGQTFVAPYRIGKPLEMDFGTDGSFGMSDGVNFYGGRYVTTESGSSFDLQDQSVTLVGFMPTTLAQKAVLGAMQSAADPRARRTAKVGADGNLIISVNGYKLTLKPNGPAKSRLPTGSPTPTAVP